MRDLNHYISVRAETAVEMSTGVVVGKRAACVFTAEVDTGLVSPSDPQLALGC